MIREGRLRRSLLVSICYSSLKSRFRSLRNGVPPRVCGDGFCCYFEQLPITDQAWLRVMQKTGRKKRGSALSRRQRSNEPSRGGDATSNPASPSAPGAALSNGDRAKVVTITDVARRAR